MARIGQIIYNVQDWYRKDVYTSTSNDNWSITISSDQPNYLDKKINIFDFNIVSRFNNFSKLSVQAPFGTKFVLNEIKNITVGKTGIYELDENILVTSLKFLRPKQYIPPDQNTQEESYRELYNVIIDFLY